MHSQVTCIVDPEISRLARLCAADHPDACLVCERTVAGPDWTALFRISRSVERCSSGGTPNKVQVFALFGCRNELMCYIFRRK